MRLNCTRLICMYACMVSNQSVRSKTAPVGGDQPKLTINLFMCIVTVINTMNSSTMANHS